MDRSGPPQCPGDSTGFVISLGDQHSSHGMPFGKRVIYQTLGLFGSSIKSVFIKPVAFIKFGALERQSQKGIFIFIALYFNPVSG